MKAKYIIHAVGLVWDGGKNEEAQLLYRAYRKSLELATENGCHSIGFPLISTGLFGYPVDLAWREAIRACNDYLENNPSADLHICFAVLNDQIFAISRKTLRKIAPKYIIAVRSDWKIKEMPQQCKHFVLTRAFSDQQMQALRRGNIPQEMEDKWFWYMENDTLYAYRSWTGNCMYIIRFSADRHHEVTVNRDYEQYKCTSIEEDEETLNRLLSWWSGSTYDYYHEWLSETLDTIKKKRMIE